MASFRAEQRLILLSAGTAARRQATQAETWRLMADADWARMAESLRVRKLLPALGPRMLELAAGRADPHFADAVAQSIEAARPHAMALMLVGAQVTDALAAEGIPATPLKGPLLGETVYGTPERRLSSDIDLLVAPEQLQAAVAVVRGLGYGAPADHVSASGRPLLHFALEHEQMPPVELHWRIHWYEGRFAHERLIAPSGAEPGWKPTLADELASLLLFYARDGFAGLRLAVDLSAWWDKFGSELEQGALDEVLQAYPQLERALLVALRVAEWVVGLPSSRIASPMPRGRIRDRMAARLANPNPRISQSQQYADMGFIDGLLTPATEIPAFLRRQVFLPNAVIVEYARCNGDFRARSSADYAMRVLARYGVSMMRSLLLPTEGGGTSAHAALSGR